MTDPTGTVGQLRDATPDLVTLATRGGPKFLARLQQLGEAIDRHQEAFVRLGVGQDAEAALQEATAQREAAKADRMAAATELAKARQDAAAILAAAKADRTAAAAVLADAQAHAAGVRAKEQQAVAAGDVARQAGARAAVAQRKSEAAERDFVGRINKLKAALSTM